MKVLERIVDGLIRELVSTIPSLALSEAERHNRRYLCSQAAASEISSCQQETLHGFCRPGEEFD